MHELLKAGDPTKKAEGELTGAKRILETLKELLPGVFDVVTIDALYANAPLLNACLAAGLIAIVRLKGENRILKKEAAALFDRGGGEIDNFYTVNRKGEYTLVISRSGEFNMPGMQDKVRVVRYTEIPVLINGDRDLRTNRKGELKRKEKEVWVICTDTMLSVRTIWKIAHIRWDIENCCFNVLSKQGNLKHLYCHAASDQILTLIYMAFNLRELYLFHYRARDFVGQGYTQANFITLIACELRNVPVWNMLIRRCAS